MKNNVQIIQEVRNLIANDDAEKALGVLYAKESGEFGDTDQEQFILFSYRLKKIKNNDILDIA